MIPSVRNSSRLAETLRYLYTLQKSGMKFGLQNIALLLAGVGNPHHNFSSVHIAGTNGKGSTASMLSAIMTAAGYRTGLYTSPHMLSFSERIRINGIPIPEQRIAGYTDFLRPMIQKIHATFFEATTAIAFMYFAEEDVDIAIVEVGLGGRLDSTNILTPLLSIITTIDYDHMEYLGNTLSAIAKEKAGIIKFSTPCLTAETKDSVLSVLARTARQRGAPMLVVRELTDATMISGGLERNTLSLETPLHSYRHLTVELSGIHQVTNAATAVLAAEYLSKFYTITKKAIRKGLRYTCRFSGLRGRLQILRRRPLTIVDVAHNPQGIRSTVDSLMMYGYQHCIVVFGVMSDKNVKEMLKHLRPITRLLVAARPKIERAMIVEKIIAEAEAAGIRALPAGTTEKAILKAIRLARKHHCPVLVIGSHYLAGEVFQKIHSYKT